jgi:hypothetical protein
VQSFKQIEDPSGSGLVQIAGRFVGQQEPGITDQSPGQRHALLLSTGELSRAMIAAVLQIDLLKPFRCLIKRLPLYHSTREERHGYVFKRRKLR